MCCIRIEMIEKEFERAKTKSEGIANKFESDNAVVHAKVIAKLGEAPLKNPLKPCLE